MFRFDGGEIVRLKKNLPDLGLESGDCGILWGVYAYDPPFYEATFIDREENEIDASFDEQDVEELMNVDETPFPDILEKFRDSLRSLEN